MRLLLALAGQACLCDVKPFSECAGHACRIAFKPQQQTLAVAAASGIWSTVLHMLPTSRLSRWEPGPPGCPACACSPRRCHRQQAPTHHAAVRMCAVLQQAPTAPATLSAGAAVDAGLGRGTEAGVRGGTCLQPGVPGGARTRGWRPGVAAGPSQQQRALRPGDHHG